MLMHNCDHCGREATVHELTVVNGVKTERHLCEACAAKEGMVGQPQVPIQQLMTKFSIPAAIAVTALRGSGCASCGQTFGEFKQSGLLGCARCYEVFEQQLAPMLERAHEGSSRHLGKIPRRACNAEKGTTAAGLTLLQERAARLRTIREQLEEAVKTEQYERAAILRDELRKIDADVRTEGRGSK